MFLDKTILPWDPNYSIGIKSNKFCGHLWKDSFLQMEGDVKDTLEQFYKDAKLDSLETLSRSYGAYSDKAYPHLDYH